jgi:hypothetical protein
MPRGKDWFWWRIQRQHKWGTGSVMVSPGQVLNSAAAPGTGHLGSQRIITVSHLHHNLPMDPSVTSGHSPFWSTHQEQENTQQSHLLDHSPAFPRDLSLVWEECCEPL